MKRMGGNGKSHIFIYKHISMRYKNNVLDKLNQLNSIASRLQVQVNRGGTQEQVLESLEMLKETIEQTREMVSIEHDDFAQQFAGQ